MFQKMLWYSLLAAQLLPWVLFAQGPRRYKTAYPNLGRRLVANCSNSCIVCASAYKIEWSLRISPTVQTLTVMQVVNTADGSTSLTTLTNGFGDFEMSQLSTFITLSPAGVHTSSVADLDLVITYPTQYAVIPDDYHWSGTLITKDACATSTEPIGEGNAPGPSPLPTPAFSVVEAVLVNTVTAATSVTDTDGWFYDLEIVPFDDPLSPYFDDGAIKACTPNCNDLPGGLGGAASIETTPPALTVAFVTACQRSTNGVDGVETLSDCSAVSGGTPAPPATPKTASSGLTSDTRHTTTNSEGSIIIVAGSSVSGGGSGNSHTITSAQGSTNAQSLTNAQGSATARDSTATIVETQPSGGQGVGSNLYVSTNTLGQTIVGTGASSQQITLVNPAGATVVIQSGSLASPGSGSGPGGGITVTDERGSTMVVQGGVTGTISVVPGEGTVLIEDTITLTSWVPGATFTAASSGGSGAGTAEPGVQNEAGMLLIPSALAVSGVLVLTIVVAVIIL